MRGRVKWFNSKRGYGFITAEDGEELYVDTNATQDIILQEGEVVTFTKEKGPKGWQAMSVIREDTSGTYISDSFDTANDGQREVKNDFNKKIDSQTREENMKDKVSEKSSNLRIVEAKQRATELAQMEPQLLMGYVAALLERLITQQVEGTDKILSELQLMQGDTDGGGGVLVRNPDYQPLSVKLYRSNEE